jgi:MFS family permease
MSRSTGVGTFSDRLLRRKWLYLLYVLSSLTFVLGVLVWKFHAHWRWSLFVWGVVIGAVALAVTEVGDLVAVRHVNTPEIRTRFRRRQPLVITVWLVGGAVIGTVAASLSLAWYDVLAAAGVLVIQARGVVAVTRRVRNRA